MSCINCVRCLILNRTTAQTSYFLYSNLVTRAQLIDSQDLSGTESLSKQVNCPHLSTEDTVGICCLRRSQETLVKRLQQGGEEDYDGGGINKTQKLTSKVSEGGWKGGNKVLRNKEPERTEKGLFTLVEMATNSVLPLTWSLSDYGQRGRSSALCWERRGHNSIKPLICFLTRLTLKGLILHSLDIFISNPKWFKHLISQHDGKQSWGLWQSSYGDVWGVQNVCVCVCKWSDFLLSSQRWNDEESHRPLKAKTKIRNKWVSPAEISAP